jgi:hypothetical protein
MKPLQFVFLMLLAVAMTGCQSEPPFTKVAGTITKNGEPVSMVEVRFVPVDDKLGKYIASGISDEEGKFTIAIPGREDEVCCEGPCKVTLREAPVPGDIRGQLESNEGRGGGGNKLMQYKKSLKNRPIPRKYERLHSTPLMFEVTAGQAQYDIEM